MIGSEIDVDLKIFDAVIFHYTLVISSENHISEKFARQISQFPGPKILFLQDEYRWVDRTSRAAKKLGVTVIYTVVNENIIRKIYRDDYFDNVRFEQTLTGFVPEHFIQLPVPDYRDRRIDIGYRARKLPAWCGSFARQKWQIGEGILQAADKYNLKCDIAMSEVSRIYGDDWIKFLSNCKATLGTESGASFIDYTGQVFQDIEAYEATHPDASFEEIRDKFLEGRDGDIVINAISPRVFEAAALRTLMIMYPGTYSGVVEPGHHYVELKSDHSNMDEVVAILRDPVRAKKIIDNAYNEIACSPRWTHKRFVEECDQLLDEELNKTGFRTGRLKDAKSIAVILQDLKKISRVLEEREKRKMQFVLFLQNLRIGTYNFVKNKFPSFLSKPMISLGHTTMRMAKPFFKKVLLRG